MAGRFHLASRPADARLISTETLVLSGCGIVAAMALLLCEFKLKRAGHASAKVAWCCSSSWSTNGACTTDPCG
jgi:hypothetical protein